MQSAEPIRAIVTERMIRMNARKIWCAWLLGALPIVMPVQAAVDMVVAETHNAEHPVVPSLHFMAKNLAERSKGELALTVKPEGELGNESAVLKKLRAGQLAFGRISMSELGDVQTAKLIALPYLFRSRDHMWNVLKGDFGKRLEADIAASGVVVVAFFDSGTRNFYSSKKQIKSRSDFEGLKIRVQPSAVFQDLITQLGGTPVVLPYAKVVDALKSGEVDAAENNLPSFVGAEHYKYAKYLSLDEHSMVPDILLMSKTVWDSLKPQQQAMVKEAGAAASEYMGKLWAEREKEALATAKKAGVQILPRSQMSITGIEAFAVRLYSKYLRDEKDLEAVLKIVSTK